MNFKEAKGQFIQTWGVLGSDWGVNKTMAQVHALLMIAPQALSAEEIMEQLSISRGNANMNIRSLMDWGLVYKELKPGERREYFVAEKDIWEISKRIIRERKKRELDPMKKVIDSLASLPGDPNDKEYESFIKAVQDIQTVAASTDNLLNKMMLAEKHWFFGRFFKLFM